MHRTDISRPAGFTLIELMLSIAVIGILMAMLGASAYSARQKAYASTATSETQQIAAAFKAYYLAHHQWPDGFNSGWKELGKDNLGPLLAGSGGDGVVYLDLPESRFEGGMFRDPWGNPYQVQTAAPDPTEVGDLFEGAVSFPNHMRHYGEDGVFDKKASEWKETWDDYSL